MNAKQAIQPKESSKLVLIKGNYEKRRKSALTKNGIYAKPLNLQRKKDGR